MAVALLFPDDVSEAIDEVRLKFGTPRVRTVVPHITLIYPCTPKAPMPVVVERLNAVAQQRPPFDIELNGFRYFEGQNTVAYLAMENTEPVSGLHRLLANALADITEGGPAHFENDDFVPHVTIHDEVPRERLASLMLELEGRSFQREARIDQFVLFTNEGDGFKPVQTFALPLQ
jgi:2'-5' RNA ligase